jgi:putative transposase
MKKGLELRIYPNKHQQKLIKTTFGCTRFVHNKILAIKKELWNEYRLSFNPKLKSFKEEWKFLTKVPSQALANAYMDSMKSFDNFFKCIKGKSKAQQKFPRFKKKGKSKDSFRIACTYDKKNNGDIRIVDRNHIKIPKLGIIQFANYNDLDWTKIHIYNITIKQSSYGNYYASLCVEISEPEYKEPQYYVTSFDLGLKDFAIFDGGTVEENPTYFRKSQNKLAKEQRLLSRMIRGSKNYNEKKLKVAKIHEKIKNQRKDFQHKISTRIVNENQVIISEDLNIKGMLKNHKLAKSIQDASFGSFCNMIKYKSEQKKRIYLKIDRFFPSSKICHCCGNKYKELKLSERFWTCENCGTYLDRDENAALNILNEGLKQLKNNNKYLQNTKTLLYFNQMKKLNKYPDGTGESDTNVSKLIDTGYNSNLEWENQLSFSS